MKKKFLGLLLAVCMILPCVFMLNACGKNTTISKASWQKTFRNDSFVFETDDLMLDVTENTYGKGVEYVRLTEGNETKYYKYTTSQSSNSLGTLTPIAESEYVFGREYFAPILDFIGDNYSKFKCNDNSIGGNTYHAKLQVPADVKTLITELGKVERDKYLFIVDIRTLSGDYFKQQGSVITKVKILDKNYEDYNINDRGFITMHDFGRVYSTYFMKKSLYDIKNLNVDFKVIGGTGINYTELYFTKNAVRFCTPNVGEESEYVEGIYSVDEGVYTYYKKNKAGQWSSETVDEDAFNRVFTTYYEMFGGKPIINQNNMRLLRDEIRFWSNEPILGGQNGLQKTYYKNYSLKYEDGIVGGKWEIEIRQDLGDLSASAGIFTMTVCDVTIDIPTI